MAARLIDQIARNGTLLQSPQDASARQRIIAAADALIAELETPYERLARVGWGEPAKAAALRTAFEMGLLSKLDTTPQSAAELAAGTPADPALVGTSQASPGSVRWAADGGLPGTARVMKQLAANHYVSEAGASRYMGTPFTAVAAKPDGVLAAGLKYCFEVAMPGMHGAPAFLAATGYQDPTDADHGAVQHALGFEGPLGGYLAARPALAAAARRFAAGYARSQPRWTDCYPFAERLGLAAPPGGAPLLVDVGAGTGRALAAFADAFPAAAGPLLCEDRPDVVVAAAGEAPARLTPLAHDFFAPQPPAARGARAYLLRRVLHGWPEDKCAVVLGHLRDAMTPGYSRLLISEVMLADMGASWQHTSRDWTMLALVSSRERTESDFRSLLAKAGLKINGIWKAETGDQSVIEAILE